MAIFITILLQFLPLILKWLLSLLQGGKQLAGGQLERMNRVTWYAAQIADAAPKVGCAVGGTPPGVGAEADAVPVEGGLFQDWFFKMLVNLFHTNGKELGLKIVREVVIPYLKEQAAKTANKFDDYGVKQLERIANDPELVALLEGIG